MIDILEQFAMQYPLLFHILIIIASLVLLILAADKALDGIVNYARKLGLSGYLIGLIVISIGASMPELVSSLMGSFEGDAGVIFGTILGSNISGIALVVGASALFAKKLDLDPHVLERTEVMTFFMVLLPFILILDGVLGRIDAAVMILVYLVYIYMVWRKEGQMGGIKKDVKLERIYLDGIIFALALAVILLSGRYLVYSSIRVSSILEIPSYLVSLVIIGLGTSMPDLTVSIRSLMKGEKGIGIGNSLGSIVVKSLLFLGILALLNPIIVDPWTIAFAEFALLLSIGLIFYFTSKKMLTWKHGLILIGVYLVFILKEVFLR
ncbi:hypothetical protein GF336_01470 [Candidatus Woesearchaeota archaeon]|nr:hypothetical protein [Candidatus Woesearchaeota archaeon]